ncbi:MAG: sigma-70 family RNA polymerase sigma factor [Clostridia bacterium]|nr:sigma-70 family RNA polymerase sigma factor [Clostridia bacterium]
MAVVKETTRFTEYSRFDLYRKTKDKALRDELVQSYIYIAEILSRKFVNRGIEYDDIFQVACLGILYAVERFDPSKGVRFATYATPTVLGEIRRYFRDKGNFIKVPRKLYEIFYKAEKIRRATEGETMSVSELSRILNLPREVVEQAYEVGDSAFIQSLEHEAYADGTLTLSNLIGYEDDSFVMIENNDFLSCCLNALTEKEQEFVHLRYYKEESQKSISQKWGVSQMYVSRMERKVLEKLKNLYFKD